MHGFPCLCGGLMLSFVDKHGRADTLSDRNSAFGADNVNAVGVIVCLWLREKLYIGMDAILEAERGVSTLSKHESRVPIERVDFLGVFDVINS